MTQLFFQFWHHTENQLKKFTTMKNKTFLTALIILFAVTSCDWLNPEKEIDNIVLNDKSAQIVESNNSFGFNLFEKIISDEEVNVNLMISPLSVSQALSMTLNGAKENTLSQMQDVLGFKDFQTGDINYSNQLLVNSLVDHDSKVKMEIANSIWYRNDFTPKTDFVTTNESYYNAEVNQYDPSKPDEAKDLMNNWVEDKTHGKIDQIIDNVNPQHVMFLINAVYFKGIWKTQFKKTKTENLPFTLDNGTEINVQTMTGKVDLTYYNDEKYSVVKLPYGSGKFNMFIFLPEEGYTTKDIAAEVKNTNFKSLKESIPAEREIWLPKFEFAYKNELNDELIALGMSDAFDSNAADFGNIADIDLYISKVNHKTYIKTDEEGTEAAAVTSVEVGYTSIGPDNIIMINRSFLFAIVEDDTNSILFIGRVYDPSKN